ncbi:MAG: FG-GAP-like repeat-containing protein [candidate division WOR-3 bacterium]
MVILITLNLFATIPVSQNPWWQSGPQTYNYENVLVDIDRDGDLDLIQGNEVWHPLYMYTNTGNGLEEYPSWSSTLAEGSTALTAGDIDNDGYPDVIVGTTQGPIRIYKNLNGILEDTPSWSSNPNGFGAMEIELADIDCNGFLDIVYTDLVFGVAVYYNYGGSISPDPAWTGAAEYYNSCSAIGDIDDDGYLDMAVGTNSVGYMEQVRIYRNINGVFEDNPSYTISDNFAPMGMVFADVDNDGDLDLVRGNGGPGYPNLSWPACVHRNNNGVIESTPLWISTDATYTMKICLADFNADGYLDIAKAVYDNTEQANGVYENFNGTFGYYPAWESSDYMLSWGAIAGDIDRDGLVIATDTLYGNGSRKLFYLHHNLIPLYSLISVTINNDTVPVSEYCFNLEHAWISFTNAPDSNSVILVHFVFSTYNELIVGNVGTGTAIYHNQGASVTENKYQTQGVWVKCTPNPFFQQTTIIFNSPNIGVYSARFRIYDALGRMVWSINPNLSASGVNKIVWNGKDNQGNDLCHGIYFYELRMADITAKGKIVKLK